MQKTRPQFVKKNDQDRLSKIHDASANSLNFVIFFFTRDI